jgi:hypothetical protein
MGNHLRRAALVVMMAVVSGCAVYEAPPGYYSYNQPATYDRAWNAALGALQDAGVQVVASDPVTGTARGNKDGVDVTVLVVRQADGTTRVQFDAKSSERDPELARRFSSAYERRMGR